MKEKFDSNKQSSRFPKKIKRKTLYLTIISAILLLSICFIFYHISFKKSPTENITNNSSKSQLSNIHPFANNSDLISENISINIENGIAKINGIISNSSNSNIQDINCIFTLYNDSNEVVYDFKISNLKTPLAFC